jgi:predicted short-subunit dehydrogenase-like oxidoreductase (DUF2520 family)
MRQVPHYLIVGNGRVARHFRHYLSLLNIAHSGWHRALSPALLPELLRPATHVLLLVSDRAIEPFAAAHLRGCAAVKVHFSGALASREAWGAHPLMTFSDGLYTLDKYLSIPFVVDEGAPGFEALLPGLPNPHARLAAALKPKYHALCVLGGNFSCLLWQKFFDALESEFRLPAAIGHAYLRQQTENLLRDPASAFTGPLARGDRETVRRNLEALAGDPFQRIYQSFVDMKEGAAP